MGKPAARMGDQTAHGGVITLGCMTVMIGGQPAARMTDLHTCPMFDGPKPHVGGPILPPGSPTVLIGGLPAARMGDQATCAGPPDVIVGGCPTVIIGESGGGSGGGGGGASTAASSDGGSENGTQTDEVTAAGATAASITQQPETGQIETAPDEQPGETAEPEPAPTEDPRVYNARWQNRTVKCGDTIEMLASTANIESGTQSDFTIQKTSDNSSVATVNENTEAVGIRAEWISKKPDNRWDGEPELIFQVSAGGARAESGNQLSFHEYRNIAGREKTITRRGTNSAGETHRLRDGKFHAEFTNRRLIINIRIKLNNRTQARPSDADGTRADDAAVPIGPAVSDADKNEYKNDIEGYLSEKLKLHRHNCGRGAECDCNNECCKFNVEIHVEFVENNAHHTVDLWPGSGRASSVNWYRVKTRGNTRAHETGHLLGWFDEYADATWHGSPPRWRNNRPGALMNTGSDIPSEYYYDFRDWLHERTGEAWDPVNP